MLLLHWLLHKNLHVRVRSGVNMMRRRALCSWEGWLPCCRYQLPC